MKKHSVLRAALLAALAAALLGVPVLAAGEEAAAGSLYGTVWALLPPVLCFCLWQKDLMIKCPETGG